VVARDVLARSCSRSRGRELLTDRWTPSVSAHAETEGALNQACLASDVARQVEARCLTFVRSARITSKHLIVA
jgi:hypothetical protein